MTDMKRISVSLPDELVGAISRLKATEKYRKCTYSEIIRQLMCAGLPEIIEGAHEKGA